MMSTLKSAGRTARQVASGLRDLVMLLSWARRAGERQPFELTPVTLPDF
jgi:hypothetical protein